MQLCFSVFYSEGSRWWWLYIVVFVRIIFFSSPSLFRTLVWFCYVILWFDLFLSGQGTKRLRRDQPKQMNKKQTSCQTFFLPRLSKCCCTVFLFWNLINHTYWWAHDAQVSDILEGTRSSTVSVPSSKTSKRIWIPELQTVNIKGVCNNSLSVCAWSPKLLIHSVVILVMRPLSLNIISYRC